VKTLNYGVCYSNLILNEELLRSVNLEIVVWNNKFLKLFKINPRKLPFLGTVAR